LIPPDTEARVEFEVEGVTHYSVTFLDRSVSGRLTPEFRRPLVVSSNEAVRHGLVELSREAAAPDDVFDLFAEGWAMQAMAHLSRLAGGHHSSREISRGGLAVANLRRVQDYVHSNLAVTITLVDLSKVAGLSRRHFLRAFEALGIRRLATSALGGLRRQSDACRKETKASLKPRSTAALATPTFCDNFQDGDWPSAFGVPAAFISLLTRLRASRNEAITLKKRAKSSEIPSHR
jgi:AraC-like DNA-binding protein